MLDLFQTKKASVSEPDSKRFSSSSLVQHNSLEKESLKSTTPTLPPKNFEFVRGNLDQVVGQPKNPFDSCKKLQSTNSSGPAKATAVSVGTGTTGPLESVPTVFSEGASGEMEDVAGSIGEVRSTSGQPIVETQPTAPIGGIGEVVSTVASGMPIPEARRGLEATQTKKKGEGTRPPRKRVSAMVERPTDEELITEGIIAESVDDHCTTDKWRPTWPPRRGHPTKRGYKENAAAIKLLESVAQEPKPTVIDWRDLPKKGRHLQIPWDEVEEDVINFVSAGGTIAAYSRASGLKYTAIQAHVLRFPEFKAQVEEARKVGADALASEALNIASTPCMMEEHITVFDKNDEVVTKSVKFADNTYARKLAFQARMQLLEKWAPEKYGPNARAEVSNGMADKLRSARMRIRQELSEASKAGRIDLEGKKEWTARKKAAQEAELLERARKKLMSRKTKQDKREEAEEGDED